MPCTCPGHAFGDLNSFINAALYSIIHRLCSHNHRQVSQAMAILNKLSTACWRSFPGDRLNKQMFFVLRDLHKSAASETFGISAAREEAMPERLVTPTEVAEKTTIKTLKEMPGPSTLSNLIEFFWRDGFSRIHEIQVIAQICLLLKCYMSILFHRMNYLFVQQMAKSHFPLCQPNLPHMRKMALTIA